MSRQASVAVENSFVKGLITEATALNFPENACTDTDNCVFNYTGTVERRLGMAPEYVNPAQGDGTVNSVDYFGVADEGVAVVTYLWKNVSGDGNVNVLVTQHGTRIRFWRASEGAVGNGMDPTQQIALTAFSSASGVDIETTEAQFSNSSKRLIITHPLCDPIWVEYDADTDVVSKARLTLKVRDFEGDTSDPLSIRERPSIAYGAITPAHNYNLYNQGWRDTEISAWDGARADLPSNADVWWSYKVPVVVGGTATVDTFQAVYVANQEPGNSPAPKGHFILTIWDKDRDQATTDAATASEDVTALSSVTSFSTDARPATSAFYAGRIFYSGIKSPGISSDIYFTQIIERDDQYEKCYQDNDPTAEDLHDLLPSDGGVIRIPEAGTVVKLFAMTGFLIAFATNGVWCITGSTGLGFTANDYVVQKISTINAQTGSSFVDVAGVPAWWNQDGIYILTAPTAASPMPAIKSMTLGTIQKYYDDIPPENKPYAKGYYHVNDKIIQWIFNKHTVDGSNLNNKYSYSDILNFDTITSAWYPWSVDDPDNRIVGITVLNGTQGFTTADNVVDGSANQVVTSDPLDVITLRFSQTQATNLTFKYMTWQPDGNVTYFSEARNTSFQDWDQTDSFDSYFLTGYKLRGQGLTKSQPTWVNIYSDTTRPERASQYIFTGAFDYPTDDSNRWSQPQTLFHDSLEVTKKLKNIKRIKVRGHGKALQFKVSNYTFRPFYLEGWTTFDTRNSIP